MQYEIRTPWPDWVCVSKIGGGGFGTVYKIKRELGGTEEYAAMKVITVPENDEMIDDHRLRGESMESITKWFRDDKESIVREYSTMATMKGHPNIVYCEDVKCVQHDDGVGWDIFIRMELLTALKKRMECVNTEEKIVDLGIAMCRALVKCHEKGITHRDIKPENIFVSQDGIFKLGDFGIARTIEQTTTATLAGTYRYMAPEVYEKQKYSPSVDQYSLGLVLYQLLNGYRLPFFPQNPKQSDDEQARIRRFGGEPLPPPAHGSRRLQEIVLKACAYDPKQRFADSSEMLDALIALKEGERSAASAVPMKEDGGRDIQTDSQNGDAQEGSAFKEVIREKDTAEAANIEFFGESYNDTEKALTVSLFNQTDPNAESLIDSVQEPVISGNDEVEHSDASKNANSSQQKDADGESAQNGGEQIPEKPKQEDNTDEEEDDDRSVFIKRASVVAVILALTIGAVLLFLGRDNDPVNGKTVETNNTLNTLPLHLEWAEWSDTLPDYVSADDYEIEERTLYSSRMLETMKSTASDTIDGWELFETATEKGDFGPWSEWSEEEASELDTRQVEMQTMYRYSDKETTTGSSSTQDGWTLEDTTYSWGDYGSWSSWSMEKATESDSRKVEKQLRYRYQDKETTTSSSASLSGWTKYDEKTSGGQWGGWSDWGTDPVSENANRRVEKKTQYRYRTATIYDAIGEMFAEDYESFWENGVSEWSEWSSWSFTPCSESTTCQVKTRTVYRYQEYQQNTTYYFYRWTDWSSWSTTKVSETATRKAEEKYFYRYRDRNRIPLYHFYRWTEWSEWSETIAEESDTRKVEMVPFYRYRDCEVITVYYFSRWTEWSDFSESLIEESDTTEVQTKTEYRYKPK